MKNKLKQPPVQVIESQGNFGYDKQPGARESQLGKENSHDNDNHPPEGAGTNLEHHSSGLLGCQPALGLLSRGNPLLVGMFSSCSAHPKSALR